MAKPKSKPAGSRRKTVLLYEKTYEKLWAMRNATRLPFSQLVELAILLFEQSTCHTHADGTTVCRLPPELRGVSFDQEGKMGLYYEAESDESL